MVFQHIYTSEEIREIVNRTSQTMQEFNEACWSWWGSLSTEKQIEWNRREDVAMPVRDGPDYPDWLP